ncbi:MAG: hypothetical protein IPJ77_08105 [Planctomycetes bacterium]|nr:hypothetical protein [Planctomycetota bacterium]
MKKPWMNSGALRALSKHRGMFASSRSSSILTLRNATTRLAAGVAEEAQLEVVDARELLDLLQAAQRLRFLLEAVQVLLAAQVDRDDRHRVGDRLRRGHGPQARDERGVEQDARELLRRDEEFAAQRARRVRVLDRAHLDLGVVLRSVVDVDLEPAEHPLRSRLGRERRAIEPDRAQDRSRRVVELPVLEQVAALLGGEERVELLLQRARKPPCRVGDAERHGFELALVVDGELPPVQTSQHERREDEQHAVQDERGTAGP